jgi:hypothetical protein
LPTGFYDVRLQATTTDGAVEATVLSHEKARALGTRSRSNLPDYGGQAEIAAAFEFMD